MKRISKYKTIKERDMILPIADGVAIEIREAVNLNEFNKLSKLRMAAAKAMGAAPLQSASCPPGPGIVPVHASTTDITKVIIICKTKLANKYIFSFILFPLCLIRQIFYFIFRDRPLFLVVPLPQQMFRFFLA